MSKYIYNILALRKHAIIQGTFWLTAGGLLGNIGNYAFNLLMGRMLTSAQFGTVLSLVSLSIIISLPSAVLTMVIAKFSAEYIAKNEKNKIIRLFTKMTFYSVLLSGALFLGFLALSPFIQSFLNIDNYLYIFLIGLIVGVGFVSSVNQGFYRGLLLFKLLTILGVLAVSLKLIFSWYFVDAGYAVTGVLLAILISTIIPWIISMWPMRGYFKKKGTKSLGLRKRIVSFSFPTFAVSIATTLFLTSDLILVKHYFSEDQAGIFAATSIMGKAILYALIPVSTVLFTVIVQRFARGGNIVNESVLSMVLTIVPGLFALYIYFMYPEFIQMIFFPASEYAATVNYVSLYGLYTFLLTITFLMLNFFLGTEKTGLAFIAVAGSILQIILIVSFHESLTRVITMSIATLSVLLIVYTPFFVSQLMQSKVIVKSSST